ncbi:MAG: hypothetical protein IJ776_06435 [Paludibacteraceae bacterium]|nr:hypothetical protein [Paludibacteraceae bacterium]
MKRIFLKTLFASIFVYTIMLCGCNSNDPVLESSMDIPEICEKLSHMNMYDMIQKLNKEEYVVIKQKVDNQWTDVSNVTKEDISSDSYYQFSISDIDNTTEWVIKYNEPSTENFTKDINKNITAYRYFNEVNRDTIILFAKAWSKYMFDHYRKSAQSISYSFYYSDESGTTQSEGISIQVENSTKSEIVEKEKDFWNFIEEKKESEKFDLMIAYYDKTTHVEHFLYYDERPNPRLWYHYENYVVPVPTAL